jgi:hypothetical protein
MLCCVMLLCCREPFQRKCAFDVGDYGERGASVVLYSSGVTRVLAELYIAKQCSLVGAAGAVICAMLFDDHRAHVMLLHACVSALHTTAAAAAADRQQGWATAACR